MRSGRSKGMALLREVYAELYEVLGQLYSPREILIAAQKLIDIYSAEYSDQIYEGSPHYATEYSRPVDNMIEIHPWSVLHLGSGLVDQSQKMTVAASAMAEKKTVGHRS